MSDEQYDVEIYIRRSDGAIYLKADDLLAWLRLDALGTIFAKQLEETLERHTAAKQEEGAAT